MIGVGIGIRKSIYKEIIFDSDAVIYFTAAGITDYYIKSPINTFITLLKTNGLWSKFYFFYPIVDNLAKSSYNLVSPSTYQVTWVDTPTLSSNSISFNGTTQYGNTNFSPIAVGGFSMSDLSFGFWDATGFNSRTEIPMGITENSGAERIRAVWFNTNNNLLDIMSNDDLTGRVVFSGQAVAFWHFQRSGSTTAVYKNGVSFGSSGASDISVIPTNKVFIGATSNGNAGANTPALFSQKTYKFFYLAKAFTDAQLVILNTLINQLNTQLSR